MKKTSSSVPKYCVKIVNAYKDLKYRVVTQPILTGALTMCSETGDIVYIKTAAPFTAVSFKRKGTL